MSKLGPITNFQFIYIMSILMHDPLIYMDYKTLSKIKY